MKDKELPCKDEELPCKDEELLKKAIKENYNVIRAYFYYMTGGNKVETNDLTQDIFLLLVEKWEEAKRRNIKGWLFRAAHYKMSELLRITCIEEKLFINELFEYALETTGTDDKYFDISEKKIEEIKKDILATLSEEEKEVYSCVYEKGMSYKDTAKLLCLNYSTVTSRGHRINKKICDKISGLELDVMGSVLVLFSLLGLNGMFN